MRALVLQAAICRRCCQRRLSCLYRLCRLASLCCLFLFLPALPAQGLPAQASGPATRFLSLPSARRSTHLRGDVRFIGSATVLIRYQGFTILTDPNFLHKGDHVQLGYGLKAERLTEPALTLSQLPPLDLIVLSQSHEDHFDKLVQQQLDRRLPIVSPPDAGARLGRLGFARHIGLGNWDSLTVRKGAATLTITATPARHGPPWLSALLPAAMGTMLDFAAGAGQPRYRIYISGDTLICDDIAEIAQRFPHIDLALLHLGGSRLLGIKTSMDGADGVRMMRIVAPRTAIPIHYADYDSFRSPLPAFARAASEAGLARQVVYLKHGERF